VLINARKGGINSNINYPLRALFGIIFFWFLKVNGIYCEITCGSGITWKLIVLNLESYTWVQLQMFPE
jgi:hypothetical protein